MDITAVAAAVVPPNDREVLAREAWKRASLGTTEVHECMRNVGHHLWSEKWEPAEQLCKSKLAVVEADPDMSCLFYKYLAFALERQNKLQEAEEAKNRASAIRAQAPPKDLEAWTLAQEAFNAPMDKKGVYEEMRNVARLLLQNEWGKAEQLCNRQPALVGADPDLSSLFYKFLAFALQRQNKLQEAEDAAKKAANLKAQALRASALAESRIALPNDPEAWALGAEAFKKAALGSTEVHGYMRDLGHLFTHEEWGRAEQLCKFMFVLVQVDPDLGCFFNRFLGFALQRQAFALKSQDKLREAEDVANRANAIGAQAPFNDPEAWAFVQAALKRAPLGTKGVHEEMRNVARLLLYKEWRQAEQLSNWRLAFVKDPSQAAFFKDALAFAHLRQDKGQKADAQEGIRAINQCLTQRDWKNAEAISKKWLDISQGNPSQKVVFYNFLAHALFQQRKYEETIEAATRGIELGLGDPKVREQLGRVFSLAMDKLEAVTHISASSSSATSSAAAGPVQSSSK